MPADEHLSGEQVRRVFHGTEFAWKTDVPSASYDAPFHIATEPHDFPAEKAFGMGGGDASEMWETLNSGRIKEFEVDPAAKIHHTTTPHMDAILPMEEQEHVRAHRYDMTMFEGKLGIVYNPAVLKHTRDISFKEHTGRNPEDEMEYAHGEDWRDWIR